MARQSEEYVMTITDRNDPKLKDLRESVKFNNAWFRKSNKEANADIYPQHYVKLHARGHRYGNKKWYQTLPLDYGTSFDVYVYER